MFRIDTATAAVALPATPATGTPGYFTDGNPGGGVLATRPGAYWFNMIQEEYIYLLTQAGITPAKGNHTQIYSAINALIAGGGASLSYPKGYIHGRAPLYNSAASITIPAGLCARDSTNAENILVGTDLTLSLAASGANGLDAGAEASNTWYYAYLIMKSSDGTVASILSTVNETVSGTISPPAGYDLKRQLPIAIRNNGSSNIIPFDVLGWPEQPVIQYRSKVSNFDGSNNAGDNNVLSNGTGTSWTTINLNSYVPPISNLACINTAHLNGERTNFHFSKAGDNIVYYEHTDEYRGNKSGFIPTNSSQQIEYKRAYAAAGAPGVWVDVRGFIVNVGVF
jgi:hypothetical protein